MIPGCSLFSSLRKPTIATKATVFMHTLNLFEKHYIKSVVS